MDEINLTIQEVLSKIQDSSSKYVKRQIYKLIPDLLNNTDFNESAIQYLFEGDTKLTGLCEFSGKLNPLGQFKESSSLILNIIHYLLLNSHRKHFYQQIFAELDPSLLLKMNLGDHFYDHYKYDQKEKYLIPLEIAKVINDKRPYLDMSEIIPEIEILEIIKENFKLITKKNRGYKTKVFKFFAAFIENVSKECLFVEPTTWEEVKI